MKEQIDEAITFFEKGIEDYENILRGIVGEEYRIHVEKMLLYYSVATLALREMLN